MFFPHNEGLEHCGGNGGDCDDGDGDDDGDNNDDSSITNTRT
jgi:hypothetical protein